MHMMQVMETPNLMSRCFQSDGCSMNREIMLVVGSLMLSMTVSDCCDVCSVVRGWKPWLGTAGFGVFLWAVMSGACGQQALYGMLHA